MGAESTDYIPLSSVSVTEAEVQEVWSQLSLGRVSGTGPSVAALESLARHQSQRNFAVATNSGTSALELALEALDVGPGDEVVLPGFTFAAPASAVVHRGATPVLCDVDEATWNLEPNACGNALTARTRAIVAVDVMGNPCDFSSLSEFHVPVVEDAAEAAGARYAGKPCGSFGVASILSYHANKPIAAGEGGMVLTDEEYLATKLRLLVNHGMEPGYIHVAAGHNSRMANLTAAFALAQARRSEELVARRLDIESRYRAELADCPVQTQVVTPRGTRSVWLVCFRSQDRAALLERLRASAIDARAVWPSLDVQPFMAQWARELPTSRRLATECFWLPTFYDMTSSQIERVASVVRAFFQGRRGRER